MRWNREGGRPRSVATVAMVLAGLAPGVAAAAGYQVVAVENGGTVRGQVRTVEARPQVERYLISKDSDACGEGFRDVPLVRVRGHALLDAVVFLVGVERGKPFAAAARKVTVDQRGCRFAPRLAVMAAGGELEAINSDPILHNIHAYELTADGRRSVMNVSQPRKGDMVATRLALGSGVALKIECDAHGFMHAHVFVARNPYYAVVDATGGFEIGGVPPGRYTIKVWHGILGERSDSVEVRAGGTVGVVFSY